MSDFPYPGLRPFQRNETDIFFGREEHTDQLIEKLGHSHFIAVVGPSGCGKSSLVRTGLLAGLETGFMASAGVHWRIAEVRPGSQPFARLAEALLTEKALGPEYTTHFTENQESATAFLHVSLRRGALSLHEVLQENPLPAQTNLLLLIDQFEELFRYYQQDSADKAAAFVELLLESSRHPAVYVVITMRSDFIGDCALFYGLPEAINQGLFLTPRLTREQLQEAIEAPANVFNGEVEPHLTNRLLNDVGNDPDQLPLLQHALMRMWNLATAENSENTVLTLKHCESIGGLTQALSQHADEAFQELNAAQQKIAEILFCNLTERGEGHRDTRRPVRLEEVAIQAKVKCPQVSEVVDVFRRSGRSFLTPALGWELQPDSVLDISHESLIRQWKRLQEWIQTEAEAAELYQRLEDTAYRWERNMAGLWSGIELEIATKWRQETQPTKYWAKRYGRKEGQYFDLAMRFLDESEAQHEAELKQAEQVRQRELEQVRQQATLEHQATTARLTALGALLVMIMAIGLVLWGQLERNKAVSAEEAAQEARARAEQAEKKRTLDLFQSQLTHAALLARGENYAQAQKLLTQTRQLDQSIPATSRHARNLLDWYSQLMGESSRETYRGAGAQLFVVAVSPNGQQLAAAGEKGTLVLFDVRTGQLIKKLKGHKDNIQAVIFHPKKPLLISGGDDKRIILWSLPSGKKQTEWSAPETVKALAIHPDGSQLASGGEDNNITLWDISTGKVQYVFKGHTGSISTNGLAFSPDGKLLGSTSHDNTARLWFVATQGQVSYVLKGHTDQLQGITFSPNGQLVATSSLDETVRLWEVESGQTVRVLRGHQNAIFGLRFIKQGRYLVTASQDRTLRLWDTETGVTLRVLQGHTAGVTYVSSDDKEQIFSASIDGTIRRWDTDLPYQKMVDLPSEPASSAIAPDGQRIAVGFANGYLRWYSLPDLKLLWADQVHEADIQRLAFSPDGQFLASASFDTTAKLWQVKENELIKQQTFGGHDNAINALAFSPNSRKLATASYDGSFGLFTVDTEDLNDPYFQLAQDDGWFFSVDFDSSSTRLLTAGNDGYTQLWQLNENLKENPPQLLQTFPKVSDQSLKIPDQILWADLSPNNQDIVSVGRDWLVYVYSLENNRIHKLVGHEQTIHRAIFSPDSSQVATASGDATIRFWDLMNRVALFTLHLPSQVEEGIPLWDFDFHCTSEGHCWIAVPLTRGKLVLYHLEQIYD